MRERTSRQKQEPVVTGSAKDRLRSSRNSQTKQDMAAQARLEEKNVELRAKKLAELKERFSGKAARGDAKAGDGAQKLTKYKAYSSFDQIPKEVLSRPGRLHMDLDKEVLLAPINGCFVPFHARMIKNMARQTEGGVQFLRVNFFTPGNGKGVDDFPAAGPRRAYIKELSFRCEEAVNMDTVLRSFKEVQKRMKQKEDGGGEVQQSTGELRRLGSFPCLRDLSMRPIFGTGRRSVGTLEAHQNGFRFNLSGGKDKVDVLYSSVRNAIFEPCEGSMVVLIHLRLKNPIMIAKKKTLDLQFFAEVAAQTEDLSMRKSGNAYDPDEIMEEQREREMKVRLNKIFQEFSRKVEALESCPLKFDVPFKDLEFTGVPHKSSLKLCPCARSLVGLHEWPPFVMDLSDVDIVVFERCSLSLREFDIVFVKKDYDQMPVRVTTIPRCFLDKLKIWLSEEQLVWYTCPMNMQWQLVMKEIQKNVNKFVEKGGWDPWFVDAANGSDSDEDGDDEESDWSGGEPEDSSDAPDDDDGSDFEGDDDESAEPDPSGSEEGMDWEELEAHATKSDRHRDQEARAAKRGGPEPSRQPAKRTKR